MEVKKDTSKRQSIQSVNVFFIVLILLGLFLIVYLNRDDLEKYKESLLSVNYLTLMIVLIVTMGTIFFRSWRWYYLLLPIKEKLSFINVFRVTINGLIANFTVPGKVGVPVKAILLKNSENIEIGKSLPSILGEIFVEHSSEFLVAMVSVLMGDHLSKLYDTMRRIVVNQSIYYNVIGGMLLIILLFAVIIVLRKKRKVTQFIGNFVETIHITKKRLDYLGYSYLITIFNLIISYYVFWLLIGTLGHPEIELTFVIFAGMITNFLGLISPFPGGVGVREITIYGLYDLYYGLGGIAFLAIILMRLITYLALFLCFVIERLISRLLLSQKKESISLSELHG